MKTFDEFLIDNINKNPIELIHNCYYQLGVNEKLKDENQKLREDLEYSRSLEDSTLAAERKFRDSMKVLSDPKVVFPFIARMERNDGIPMDEMEIVED